jgi:hypothetical protein
MTISGFKSNSFLYRLQQLYNDLLLYLIHTAIISTEKKKLQEITSPRSKAFHEKFLLFKTSHN